MSLKHEAPALLDPIESQRLGGGMDHKVTNAKREREKERGGRQRAVTVEIIGSILDTFNLFSNCVDLDKITCKYVSMQRYVCIYIWSNLTRSYHTKQISGKSVEFSCYFIGYVKTVNNSALKWSTFLCESLAK